MERRRRPRPRALLGRSSREAPARRHRAVSNPGPPGNEGSPPGLRGNAVGPACPSSPATKVLTTPHQIKSTLRARLRTTRPGSALLGRLHLHEPELRLDLHRVAARTVDALALLLNITRQRILQLEGSMASFAAKLVCGHGWPPP